MIPRSADLASDWLHHRRHDLFNPPGLTNHLATLQVENDLTAVSVLAAPPVSTSNVATGHLFLDGRYLPAGGTPIAFQWRPDRIERRQELDGLALRSVTVLPVGMSAAVVQLDVTNLGAATREVDLRFHAASDVTVRLDPWLKVYPPGEKDVVGRADPERAAWIFRAPLSGAGDVQGLVAPDARLVERGVTSRLTIEPGRTVTVHWIRSVAATVAGARSGFDTLRERVVNVVGEAEDAWDRELAAIVDPADATYSGCMPILESRDPDLLRLYWMGILGVVYFRRDNPASVIGRAYDTLMPRHWQTVTFLWDYSLSSVVHALLDPEPMRRQVEHWLTTDLHHCMGTEWLTGSGLGAWYSVNDFAIVRIIGNRLRWHGDLDWLGRQVEGTSILDWVVRHAQTWEFFDRGAELADYGGIDNLLECVSNYVHEVAALNAANVYCMEQAATLLEHRGRAEQARRLRKEADAVAARVLERYSPGGWWRTGLPDGGLREVRHAYDFMTTVFALRDRLGHRGTEMLAAFRDELETPTWMRALSPQDPDAAFSTRPDHQWNGAFCAWPSESALARLQLGDIDGTVRWMRGLAKSANQGPFGQAHYADGLLDDEAGGALKADAGLPAICDWACSAGGSWASLVIEGVFGVRAGYDGITAEPEALRAFDPDARLVGLHHHGTPYVVDASGIRPA